MKNQTIWVVLLVIVAIGITIFFVNRNKELNDTQTPNSMVNDSLDNTSDDTSDTGIDVTTEVETVTPTDPINPSFPQTGYQPN